MSLIVRCIIIGVKGQIYDRFISICGGSVYNLDMAII